MVPHSRHRRTTVLLLYCTVVLLYYCTTVLLYYVTQVEVDVLGGNATARVSTTSSKTWISLHNRNDQTAQLTAQLCPQVLAGFIAFHWTSWNVVFVDELLLETDLYLGIEGERGSHGRSILLCLLLSVASSAHKSTRVSLHVHRSPSPLRSLVELLGFELCGEVMAYEPLPSHDAFVTDVRPLKVALTKALAANQRLMTNSRHFADVEGEGVVKSLEVAR